MEGETVAAPEIVYGRGLTCGAFGCHNDAVVMDYTVGSTVCLEHVGAVARLSADRERALTLLANVEEVWEGLTGTCGKDCECVIHDIRTALADLRGEGR